MASERRSGRPKLLILTPDFPPAYGGIQTMSHRLAVGLRGFERRVLTLDMPGASDVDRQSGLSIRRVAAPQRIRGRAALLNPPALTTAVAFRPDVTLSMHIITSPAAALIRRVLGARTVQYFHAKEIGARPRLAAFAARHADALVAVSAYTAGLVRGVGAATNAIRLIPPGVDIPAGDVSPIPAEAPTVLTIARLEERYKGHDVMARAFPLVRAKVPDARWVVIGDGSLRPEIERLASAHGLGEAAVFLGAVSDEERARWLRRAAVLARPVPSARDSSLGLASCSASKSCCGGRRELEGVLEGSQPLATVGSLESAERGRCSTTGSTCADGETAAGSPAIKRGG